ncbi:MAG: arginine--tRNA ligase, partial [Desulfovibrionaceae bacterium]|nr:arginine--tRNA ligase [Desulfovibrionaceae bacterium]
MRAEQCLEAALKTILAGYELSWPEKTVIEPPKDARHGDLASNVAMVAAKQAKMPPRDLAAKIAGDLADKDEAIAGAEIAGPGFLNVSFRPAFWQEVVRRVEQAGAAFGSSSACAGKKVQVEFVSANPTGPLHIGHGRGAAVGDSLIRLLRFAGCEAEAEYYINDAGRQMRLLGLSIWLHVKEQSGQQVEWPEEYYRGAYIADIAHDLLAAYPRLASLPDDESREYCYEHGMKQIFDGIKEDLVTFRVHHDVWFSEKTLVDGGAVDAAFSLLEKAGLLFEEGGALWFRTTAFGDDKDRVLRKSDGTLTYFASDIAYHCNKFSRGFDRVVDVWGADHHGYIPRMRAAVQALGQPREAFDVVLIQLVNLLKNGEQITMSTRAGKFETLADVV